jgi:predicted transcriptional regulator
MEKSSLALADSVQRMAGNGMSQREIAKALGISQATVSRLAKYQPSEQKGSLAHMIAQNAERRAILEQIYEAHHAGKDTSELWEQANAL